MRPVVATPPNHHHTNAREQGMGNKVDQAQEAKRTGWCILRTTSRRTLGLVASLTAAGIEAWSPRELRREKLPRGKRLLATAGYRETEHAIMPSFVFARARHRDDLLRALSLPINPHPSFSIFQHAGRAPLIADGEVSALRKREEQARQAIRKTRYYAVPIGQKVKPDKGGFAGMIGVVVGTHGHDAVVNFGGIFDQVKIASWMLVDDEVEGASAIAV